MAMILSLLAVLIMTLLPIAVYAQASGQLILARADQDHESALAAADAGAEDFVSRLNANNNYWNNSNGMTWTSNSAFGAWVRVPNTTTEWYWYRVNTTTTGCGNPAQTGIVCVTSSGCASVRPVTTSAPTTCPSGQVRTINLSLRAKGFLDYIYSTQYEISDTINNAACVPKHAWEGSGPSSKCNIIQFASRDVINGPLHSDDALHICGSPRFYGPVDTYFNSNASIPGDSFGAPGAYIKGGGATITAPSTCNGVSPVWMPNGPAGSIVTNEPTGGNLLIPPVTTLTQLDQAADPTLGGQNGCVFPNDVTLSTYYTGPVGHLAWTSASGAPQSAHWNATLCGSGTSSSGDITMPAQGLVIYTGGNAYIANAPSGTGGLEGQLSVAAAQYIVVTGNVTYSHGLTGSDVLGLIAGKEVQVYQPNPTTPVCIGTTTAGNCTLTIEAAILAKDYSFTVQDYNVGSYLGTLQVDGSISQKFRGPVATGNTSGAIVSGYSKSYNYDARLEYLTPPFWPSPTSATWRRTSYSELPPCPVAGSATC